MPQRLLTIVTLLVFFTGLAGPVRSNVSGGGSSLGSDPSICHDDARIRRTEQQTDTTARAFDKLGSHTKEGEFGRWLETNGYTAQTSLCQNAPQLVLEFIYNRKMTSAERLASDYYRSPDSSPGGAQNGDPSAAGARYDHGGDGGVSTQRGSMMFDTLRTVVGSCEGVRQQHGGSFSWRPSCLSAATVDGCERYMRDNPTCVAIIAQAHGGSTTPELRAQAQTLSDCRPTVFGRSPSPYTPPSAGCSPQLRSAGPGQIDPPTSHSPSNGAYYKPGKPLTGDVRETGPIRIGDRQFLYGRGEPYYNGKVLLPGISEILPFTIDVSAEAQNLRLQRHVRSTTGKIREVWGTLSPVSDGESYLMAIKFTPTAVDIGDGKGLKPLHGAQGSLLYPYRERLVPVPYSGH